MALRRDIVLAGNGGDPADCWVWSYAKTPAGYGTVTGSDGQTVYVHRLSYETHVEPIPEGWTVDHLCRTTLCWNPAHLEAVTNSENVKRAARARAKTHCPNGHAYAEHARPNRGHDCAVCHRAQERERGRRQAAARRAATLSSVDS